MGICLKFTIRDTTRFLVGIILLLLGSFIMLYDLPQIQLIGQGSGMLDVYEPIYQRLLAEIGIGIVILGAGIILIFSSFQDRARQ